MFKKSFILKPYARYINKKVNDIATNALTHQDQVFKHLISKGSQTKFGNDHRFQGIQSHKEFIEQVPVRDYEKLKPYIKLITENKEQNVLWPGLPKYLAKTSGTTSGIKYIPLTSLSIRAQIMSARYTLFNFMHKTGSPIFDGKLIFLSGSPTLDNKIGIPTGRLSGIVNHEIPAWVKKSQLPSYETNCIDDWESKLDKVVDETFNQNMTVISGIPPWVQMYFEKLIEKTGKSTIKEIFPNLKLFVHGGVNYTPYKSIMEKLIGGRIHTLETYPASEGFIGFQTDPNREDLLLNTNAGIYYEFIELSDMHSENPKRYNLNNVVLEKDYAVILSSNAGLWAYDIGDTIRFTSLDPFRIIVSGRVKHFISAFGEHVISKEIEEAMRIASLEMQLNIVDFTVAPQVNPPSNESPYHEWFIEFENLPDSLHLVEQRIDSQMAKQNIYYNDLIMGGVLQVLKIRPLQKNAFRKYMKSKGKLGGQNKVPRLMNNRDIADELIPFIETSQK